MAILENRINLIGYLKEVTLFYLFTLSKALLVVGRWFILWSMLYMEGWLSRSRFFIGVTSDSKFN